MHTQLWRNGKRYRHFNGKAYEYTHWCMSKKDADVYAVKYRKDGKLVRVTTDGTDGFAVWVYTKTGWE